MTAWIRRHRLAAFFTLSFAISWWVWPFYELDIAPTPFFACGPLVAALIIIGITEGGPGYRALGARMIRWRVGWQWWAVAVGLPFAVLAVATVANVTIWGAPAPVLANIAWGSLAFTAAIRFVDPLDGPLGEEPGWRGWALPELQRRQSPLGAAVILGAIVALWHLPLVVGRATCPGWPRRHLRHHAGLRLAVQPHRRQRPADHGVSRRAGHRQPGRSWDSPAPTPPGWTGSPVAVVSDRGRPGGGRPQRLAGGARVRDRGARPAAGRALSVHNA